MTHAIPIPEFIVTLESDLALGRYDASMRPVARANLRRDLQQLRNAAGRGDKGEACRLVRLMLAAIEHEKGALASEIDELMMSVQPWGEA